MSDATHPAERKSPATAPNPSSLDGIRGFVTAAVQFLPEGDQLEPAEVDDLFRRTYLECTEQSKDDEGGVSLALLAGAWPQVLLAWQLENRHVLAARRAIH